VHALRNFLKANNVED